jgi:hypothetical protein
MKNETNISSELNFISAAVANLPKNTPFCLPLGYFESFPAHIIETIHLSNVKVFQADNQLPITLNREENGFSVPGGYFEGFSVQLMEKIKETSQKDEAKVIGIFSKNNILKYAAAACIAGIVFISYLGTKDTGTSNEIASIEKNPVASDLSLEGIASFLEDSEESSQGTQAELAPMDTNNLLVDLDQETISQVLTELHENDIKNFIDESEIIDNTTIN